ncbi:MAG: hypothetical protein WBH01_02185 [Dehalococcoidia bacterium]
MPVPAEVQAAIVTVSGEWARYLVTVREEDREEVLIKLLKYYKDAYEDLKKLQSKF